MSRIFYDKKDNRLIVLSYAGGTKFFNPLASELGYIPLQMIGQPKPDYILQIVREPLQRWMSWFDKQYIKDLYRKTKLKNNDFDFWCSQNITKNFIDDYFSTANYTIHYDGHTAFQCYWAKTYLKGYKCNWKYLRMEDINPFFLNQKPYKPKRTIEYIGLWDKMDRDLKEYTLNKASQIYKHEIEWYNNLKFIQNYSK